MSEHIENVTKRVRELTDEYKISDEKHTEICKEALYHLWVDDMLFTDEQELEIELEIERCIKAEVK